MPFVSVIEKIQRQQQMISDEGVGNYTRGRVCSPFFPSLIARIRLIRGVITQPMTFSDFPTFTKASIA